MVKFTVKQGCLIAKVSGDVDQHNAALVREETDIKISHENVKNLIFDFTNLDFMDSSGLGIIIGRYKIISSLGGKVAIAVTKPTIRRLLELSGINKIMYVTESLTDALKSL
jgi:stage II sporulation protein AA (anti-sigma F factor antagonist)